MCFTVVNSNATETRPARRPQAHLFDLLGDSSIEFLGVLLEHAGALRRLNVDAVKVAGRVLRAAEAAATGAGGGCVRACARGPRGPRTVYCVRALAGRLVRAPGTVHRSAPASRSPQRATKPSRRHGRGTRVCGGSSCGRFFRQARRKEHKRLARAGLASVTSVDGGPDWLAAAGFDAEYLAQVWAHCCLSAACARVGVFRSACSGFKKRPRLGTSRTRLEDQRCQAAGTRYVTAWRGVGGVVGACTCVACVGPDASYRFVAYCLRTPCEK